MPFQVESRKCRAPVEVAFREDEIKIQHSRLHIIKGYSH
jgi:hypothetical protein